MADEEQIISRLDSLKNEIEFIKEHLIDVTLTSDDILSLSQAEEDFKEGRTKRL